MAARKKSGSGPSFSRHVAPFAPVALALAMQAGTGGQPATTPSPSAQQASFTQSCSAPHFPSSTATVMDDSSCGIAGSGGAETTQNEAKNNFCAPDLPKPASLQDMIALQTKVQQDSSISFGNTRSHPLSNQAGPQQNRAPLVALGEGDEVVIQGYVLIARQEGAESVNCGTKVPNQPAYHDIHISLVQNPGDAECSGIVVEMTPHHRPAAWTPALVNEAASAKVLVRVTGQRMFDSSHTPCTNGTAVQGDPKRSSLWEVHPIYKFEVCPQGDCSSGGWVPLEQWQTNEENLP